LTTAQSANGTNPAANAHLAARRFPRSAKKSIAPATATPASAVRGHPRVEGSEARGNEEQHGHEARHPTRVAGAAILSG
jgi:hypothetical protein